MSNKTEKINFRVTPAQKEIISALANKRNMSISLYAMHTALQSTTINVIDHSAEIAKHLCLLTTEINSLKLNHPNINFKNIDRECDCIWQCLR